MKLNTLLLGATSAIPLAILAAPAMAAVPIPEVYTSQALFDSQHTGLATNNLIFNVMYATNTTPSYSQTGVTFSVPSTQSLYELPANATLPSSHLAALLSGPGILGAYDIKSSGSVLGLTLASFYGAQTVSYLVNGVSGSLALGANGANSFIGFDSGSNAVPVNVVFSFSQQSSLDVLSFQTGALTNVTPTPAPAVPEPASWAMMILGMGAIGFAMRNAKRRSDDKFDAKIKKITYGAIA